MTDTGRSHRLSFGRVKIAAAAAALLAMGGGAGAIIAAHSRPTVTMAPAMPVPIRAISDGSIVTVRGRVAEVFGNKFVIADASGRALVDSGREGEGTTAVTAGQQVTVQGRFDDGFISASFLVGPDNKVVALRPLGHERRGARDDHGPGQDGRPGTRGEPTASAPAPAAAPVRVAPPASPTGT